MSYAPIVKNEFRELFKEIIQPDHSIRIQTVTENELELQYLLILWVNP